MPRKSKLHDEIDYVHLEHACRYGNFIRTDPEAYPKGTELVVFELCREIGTNKNPEDNLDCAGGIKETAVGVEMDVGGFVFCHENVHSHGSCLADAME